MILGHSLGGGLASLPHSQLRTAKALASALAQGSLAFLDCHPLLLHGVPKPPPPNGNPPIDTACRISA